MFSWNAMVNTRICKYQCEVFFTSMMFSYKSLLQVHDMINKIDDGSGVLDFEDFLTVSKE